MTSTKKPKEITIKIPTQVFTKIGHFIKDKKKYVGAVGLTGVIILFGVGFDFGYDHRGLHFNCKYTAPDPKDIKQLIPLGNREKKSEDINIKVSK